MLVLSALVVVCYVAVHKALAHGIVAFASRQYVHDFELPDSVSRWLCVVFVRSILG